MDWESASPFAELTCFRTDGSERVFDARVRGVPDPREPAWFYYVRPSGRKYRGRKAYFASFKEIGFRQLQIEALKNELPKRYRGYCITCALVPRVAAYHQAQVRSSRSLANGELRTDKATKVWNRMVSEGTASYDEIEDRFCHPPLAKRDA